MESRCVFRQISDEAFEGYRQISEVHHFRRGERIIRQGERPAGVYLLRAGLVRLAYLEPTGRTRILTLAHPATLLGLVESVTGSAATLNAETVLDSEFEFIPRRHFVRYFLSTPDLMLPLLIHLSEEYSGLLETVCASEGGATPARERLLKVLWELAQGCGENTEEGVLLGTRVTVQELAAHLDLSRQWTSNLLRELMEEGAVRRIGRRLLLTPSATPKT